MKRMKTADLAAGILLAATWLIGTPAAAQDVVAVLSSESSAYREALAGFEETFGHSVPTFTLSKGEIQLPGSPKVIVAIGGKAATHRYPRDAALVYCLTPGIWVGPDQHPGPRIRIFVSPPPEVLLLKFQALQPRLKRLAIVEVSKSPSIAMYFEELKRTGMVHGVEVRIDYLGGADALPNHLRSLAGHVDALWMAPDPLLITPTAFAAAKEFGRSNNMPLYVPLDSLVDKGATASFTSSFRESGRTAGRVAAKAAAGTLGHVEDVYPDSYELTINLTAAAQSGLVIPADVIKKANRVVP